MKNYFNLIQLNISEGPDWQQVNTGLARVSHYAGHHYRRHYHSHRHHRRRPPPSPSTPPPPLYHHRRRRRRRRRRHTQSPSSSSSSPFTPPSVSHVILSVALTICIFNFDPFPCLHYNDVIMGAIASQITSLTIVYSTVYSDADQSKHQSSTSLAFVRGIHRGPGNSPHKGPVTQKMIPFDDVIMVWNAKVTFILDLVMSVIN